MKILLPLLLIVSFLYVILILAASLLIVIAYPLSWLFSFSLFEASILFIVLLSFFIYLIKQIINAKMSLLFMNNDEDKDEDYFDEDDLYHEAKRTQLNEMYNRLRAMKKRHF